MLFFETEIQSLLEKLKEWIPKTNEGDKREAINLAKKRIKVGNSDFLYHDFEDLFNQLENGN